MVEPWKTIKTEPIGNFRIFSIRSDTKISPRTGREHDFYVIDSVDWVNVIALTPDNQIVMVHQFRHGSGSIELEIPGGMMDASDPSPVSTGVRELREETGYEGTDAEIIGRIYANPAIMSNTCYTVLVRNCELKHKPSLDSGEDLTASLLDPAEIPALVAGGKIGHSLVVVALYHFELWKKRREGEVPPDPI